MRRKETYVVIVNEPAVQRVGSSGAGGRPELFFLGTLRGFRLASSSLSSGTPNTTPGRGRLVFELSWNLTSSWFLHSSAASRGSWTLGIANGAVLQIEVLGDPRIVLA